MDSHQVCRVMKRTQISAFFDHFYHFIIDDNRLGNLHPTVENTVSNRIHFF
jgi:hypothetical protein